MQTFESQKSCYLPFYAFLLKPMHRLLQYRTVLERLMRHYSESHVDMQDCRGMPIGCIFWSCPFFKRSHVKTPWPVDGGKSVNKTKQRRLSGALSWCLRGKRELRPKMYRTSASGIAFLGLCRTHPGRVSLEYHGLDIARKSSAFELKQLDASGHIQQSIVCRLTPSQPKVTTDTEYLCTVLRSWHHNYNRCPWWSSITLIAPFFWTN